ncbi:MAG: GNAT family N-acetyltransferase [Pseudomonadota bacterium]
MATIPTIETERLRLRPFRDEDHGTYAAFLADEDAMRYIGATRDASASWRVMATFCGHWHLRGYGPFAVAEKQSDQFVGYCGPWFPYDKPEQEIMWGIVPVAQRQGYASEAALAARKWAYEEAGWPAAVSYISPENIASQGVARRLGATAGETIAYNEKLMVQVWRHPSADSLRNARGAA